MKTIISLNVTEGKTVPIVTGLIADELAEYIPSPGTVIAIVDKQVEGWFGRYFEGVPYSTMVAGESLKTLDTIEQLTVGLLESGADRDTFLMGVGGGLVCDVTGFLASTYMRGIPFGFVPTTLLAQVDAALGGKNGVNVQGYKNMLGTFTQPEFVLCCTDALATLNDRLYCAGLAEVIKIALAADAELFTFIEQHAHAIAIRRDDVLNEIIRRAVSLKIAIVERDEKEKGERRKLNLGHTVGHAIERTADDILHGEAVSIGLACVARFSLRQGWLAAGDCERITALLQYFHLPTTCAIPTADLHNAILHDKKKSGVLLHYIALSEIGKAVETDVDIMKYELYDV
ncbi:MAG: 3-dehydroquinate synthase [Prevotellaceae bacterium]|jgi:3-dehydroquinate synthase|nr:3-dehydroquinate synthase [Prevotellaceae bacterium]